MTINTNCCKCLVKLSLTLPDGADECAAKVACRFILCANCLPGPLTKRTSKTRKMTEPRAARLPYVD